MRNVFGNEGGRQNVLLKNTFLAELFRNQHKFEVQHISVFVKNNENVVKSECFHKNFSEG